MEQNRARRDTAGDRSPARPTSPVVARATTAGLLIAFVVTAWCYLFVFGRLHHLNFSLGGMLERNIENATRPSAYLWNPLSASVGIGALVGSLVAVYLILRSIRSNVPLPGGSAHCGARGNAEANAAGSGSSVVLEEFASSFRLSSEHALFLPNGVDTGCARAGSREERKITISIDSTFQNVLQGLIDEHGEAAVLDAGLAMDAGAYLQPNPRLLYNAPVFIHHGIEGTPTGLSHSLSPITGCAVADLLWDVGAVHDAGGGTGVLHLTSSIHHAAILRSEGLHGVAIHPHVWARPELMTMWPLPRRMLRSLEYRWPSQSSQAAERFAQWLARLIIDAGVTTIKYDLSRYYPPIMGHESIVHLMAPRLMFRRFISDFVAPRLKRSGLEVVKSGPLLSDYLRRPHAKHDPQNVFSVSRLLPDLYGEDVLLGTADVPSQVRGIRLRRPEPSKPQTIGERAQPESQPEEHARYEFVRGTNGRWRLVFEDETGEFRDLNGLRMFAALIEHPNIPISAKHLYDQFSGRGGPGEWVSSDSPAGLRPVGAGLEDIAGTGLNGITGRARPGDRIPLQQYQQPRKAISQIDYVIRSLEEDLTVLRDSEEPDQDSKAEEIESQLDRLAQRRTTLADIVDERGPYAARVGRSFRNARDKLRERDMPRLAKHLSSAVGSFETDLLCYEPAEHGEPLLDWTVRWEL